MSVAFYRTFPSKGTRLVTRLSNVSDWSMRLVFGRYRPPIDPAAMLMKLLALPDSETLPFEEAALWS